MVCFKFGLLGPYFSRGKEDFVFRFEDNEFFFSDYRVAFQIIM